MWYAAYRRMMLLSNVQVPKVRAERGVTGETEAGAAMPGAAETGLDAGRELPL